MSNPWVETLLELGVRRPGRYAGGEYFVHPPEPPAPGDLRIGLVFPDTYEVGMSNLGLAILYSLLRGRQGVFVDRIFAPWQDMETCLRDGRLPIASRDFGIPVRDFHALGFSLAYELTYTNVLTVLDLAGIPLRSGDRDGSHPLILAGGPGAAHPEPLAPFVDAFLLGEGEAWIDDMIDGLCEAGLPGSLDRDRAGAWFDGLDGGYAPALHGAEPDPQTGLLCLGGTLAQRRWLRDLGQAPDLTLFPVPAAEAVFDRVSLEIARGCPQGCRFCEAGIFYRPFRERPAAALLDEAARRTRLTGMDELGLASLSTADRSDLDELVGSLVPMLADDHTALSVSSLRAYGVGERVLQVMAEGRTSSLTLAPETGGRLRGVINKNVCDQDLFDAVERMARAGWNRVKLYFMLGLPTERESDLEEIGELCNEVMKLGRTHSPGRFTLAVSASLFVPRPHTALQWAQMADYDTLEERVRFLSRRLPRKAEFRWHDPATSRLEAVLARGDRRVADLLEAAWRNGARMDGWAECFQPDTWAAAFKETGLETKPYLTDLTPGCRLPWDHVDLGVAPAWLEAEWMRAMEGRPTEACRPGDDPPLCRGCGLPCREEPLPPVGPVPAPAPRDQAEEEPGRHPFRLVYERRGDARVLGNLDLQRSLQRAFRRAGLELEYTKGFHPRLRMSAGPSLPLGMEGRREWVDVVFARREEAEADDLLDRINRVQVAGLRFIEVKPLDSLKPAPPGWAEYQVTLNEPLDPDDLAGARARWAGEGFTCERKRKRVDLRAGILSCELTGEADLRLRLALPRAPRPKEILEDLGLQPKAIIRLGFDGI